MSDERWTNNDDHFSVQSSAFGCSLAAALLDGLLSILHGHTPHLPGVQIVESPQCLNGFSAACQPNIFLHDLIRSTGSWRLAGRGAD